MRRFLCVAAMLAAACLLAPVGSASSDEAYHDMIGDGWHAWVVSGDQADLSSASPDSPCHVKASGWKMLSKWRLKDEDAPWFVRGQLQQKWGWKLVVHNAGDAPFRLAARFDLYSDEDIHLDWTGYAGSDLGQDSAIDNALQPGQTRLFTGVSSYDLERHKGEGRPARVHWVVKAY